MYEVRRGYLKEVIKALPEDAEVVAVVPLLTRKPGTMEMECDVLVKLVPAKHSPVRTPAVRKPAPSPPSPATNTSRTKKSPA